MFTRIVKMEFQEDQIPSFLENFETVKNKIRNFPGCEFLELYRDKDSPTIFFTYSKWNDPQDLEAYRNSKLFHGIWATTKVKFSARPQAWSVDTLAHLA